MLSTIFHVSDWPRATKFNGKDMGKWVLSYTAGGTVHCYDLFGRQLAISAKCTHPFILVQGIWDKIIHCSIVCSGER